MRVKGAAICVGCCALLAPSVVQAHISLHPNTIPAGAFVTLDVRVPGEQAGAYAYKVDMLVPPGFTEIDTENVPGWSVREITSKLAKPIQTDEGPVSEEVSRIVWTGDRSRLGRLENGQFIEFPLSLAIPGNIAGRSLAFKAVQYYSNGKAIHWIGPLSGEYPAPTINVTARGGVIEDIAGGEAGPTPGEEPPPQQGRLVACVPMVACLTHWYTSLLYVVPVLIVGGWGWWSARRVGRRQPPPSAANRQA